ncbi:hypothetical protein GCM10022221_76630 [Actinocorallia aurea]
MIMSAAPPRPGAPKAHGRAAAVGLPLSAAVAVALLGAAGLGCGAFALLGDGPSPLLFAALAAVVAASAALALLAVRARIAQLARLMSQDHEAYRQQRDAAWRAHLLRVNTAERELLQDVLAGMPAVLAGEPAAEPDRAEMAAGIHDLVQQFVVMGTAAADKRLAHEEEKARLRADADEAAERAESARVAVLGLSRDVQSTMVLLFKEASDLADVADAGARELGMRMAHATAQAGRHAQRLAVLCGEPPGQQWPEPVALVEVAAAGQGRILEFARVDIVGDQTVAVVAAAAEPLIHLVAEALANATRYSAPSTRVEVMVTPTDRGAVLRVDDAGIGMEEHRLAEAREIASGRRPVGLADVEQVPRLGLAIMGHFAREHGFGVHLETSPYLGVRVIVHVPQRLVTTVAEPGELPAPRGPEPGGPRHARSEERTSAGLPRRRTRRGAAAEAAEDTAVSEEASPAPSPASPDQAARLMGALVDLTKAERPTTKDG